ncbi:unnamed protein product, partial [Laminaria digitata]
PSPLPLLGVRAPGPAVFQIWRSNKAFSGRAATDAAAILMANAVQPPSSSSPSPAAAAAKARLATAKKKAARRARAAAAAAADSAAAAAKTGTPEEAEAAQSAAATATTRAEGAEAAAAEAATVAAKSASAAAAAKATAAAAAAAAAESIAAAAAKERAAAAAAAAEEASAGFELAYGIAHDGGGVLRCKWAPDGPFDGAGVDGKTGEGAEALGLLAAVFFDGSLRVYVCPDPDEVSAAASAEEVSGGGAGGGAGAKGAAAKVGSQKNRKGGGVGNKGGGGVVLQMKPVLQVELKRTEMMCLDWSPHDPNLLLVGAADGTVCTWKVSLGVDVDDNAGTQVSRPPLRQYACPAIGISEPIQAVVFDVAWCPDSPEMFATTGAGHILSVWDVSDVFEPLCAYPLRANRCDGTSLRWGPG